MPIALLAYHFVAKITETESEGRDIRPSSCAAIDQGAGKATGPYVWMESGKRPYRLYHTRVIL
jgi:hypothetical protein